MSSIGDYFRNLAPDTDGWRRPLSEDEPPHPTYVDHERYRVVCRECPWFYVRLGASYRDLQLMGRQHRHNMSGGGE